MDNQKFNLILDKLLERTEEEKLDWKTTSDRDTFLVALKDSSISINYSFSEDRGKGFYTFDFRNETGDIAESVSMYEFSDNKTELEKAKKLYNLVRQQSLRIDQTVDRILEQLAA